MKHILNAALVASTCCWGPDANVAEDNGKDGGGAPAPEPKQENKGEVILALAEKMVGATEKVAKAVESVETLAKGIEERAKRQPVTENGTARTAPQKSIDFEVVDAYDNKAPGFKAARMVIVNAKASLPEYSGKTPLEIAKSMMEHDKRYEDTVRDIMFRREFLDRREKALSAGIGSEGGFLVQPTYGDFIELLRPIVAVLNLKPRILPMPTGLLNLGRMDSGATASYVGENTARNASQPSTGEVKLSAKKLVCIVPISNDLLRRSNAEMVVRDDIQRTAGARKDLAFIRGDGGQSTPRGLRNFAANTVGAAGTAGAGNVSVAQVVKAFSDARTKVRTTDGIILEPGVILSPRSEEFLMSLRDTAGWVFPEMQNGFIRKMPYAVSPQIPDNLGSGDESEVIVADFSHVLIGDTGVFGVESMNGAAYTDASGTVVAGYSNDQTVMKLVDEHDLGVKHTSKVCLINTVHWGA